MILCSCLECVFKPGHDDDEFLWQDEWDVVAVVPFCRPLFVHDKMQIASTFRFPSDSCRLSHNVWFILFVLITASFSAVVVVVEVVDVCNRDLVIMGNDVDRNKQSFWDKKKRSNSEDSSRYTLYGAMYKVFLLKLFPYGLENEKIRLAPLLCIAAGSSPGM